jgi:hypothetical protein
MAIRKRVFWRCVGNDTLMLDDGYDIVWHFTKGVIIGNAPFPRYRGAVKTSAKYQDHLFNCASALPSIRIRTVALFAVCFWAFLLVHFDLTNCQGYLLGMFHRVKGTALRTQDSCEYYWLYHLPVRLHSSPQIHKSLASTV